MTMKQVRTPGHEPAARDLMTDDRECTIAIQALCRGELETAVMAVTGAAARPGHEHISLRFGRVLLYLEDRAALEALVQIVERASAMADKVFGEVEDAFVEAEQRERLRIVRTGERTARPPRR
jgi:hypothetical protein